MPSWSVEYQQETVDLGKDGRPVRGVKIGFVTGSGVHASVFLAQGDYSLDNVRFAIQNRVKEIDAVHKLTG